MPTYSSFATAALPNFRVRKLGDLETLIGEFGVMAFSQAQKGSRSLGKALIFIQSL